MILQTIMSVIVRKECVIFEFAQFFFFCLLVFFLITPTTKPEPIVHVDFATYLLWGVNVMQFHKQGRNIVSSVSFYMYAESAKFLTS